MSSPLRARWLPIRNVSRSRLDLSAQCASSITRTTGECLVRCSSAPSTSSNSRARASAGSPAVSGSPSSGSNRASPRVVRPGSIEATASAPISCTRSRSTAVNGANGSPSVPSSRQPPVSTRAPAAAAVRPNSLTSLDLPTPASPPSSTADGPPWRALAKAASRAAICSSRPTRTGLDARPLISEVSIPRGSDIPERSLATDGTVMAASGGVMGSGRLARLAGHRLAGGLGAERPVHVVGDGGQDEPVGLVRLVGPTTADPDRDPGEPALVRPRSHLAAVLGGQFTENLGMHGSSSAPGEPGLAPHILKIRRKAPPPASGECLIFPAQKGLGPAKPRGIGLSRLSPGLDDETSG